MAENVNRRDFLRKSITASAGVAAAASFEEKILLAHAEENLGAAAPAVSQASAKVADFPSGKIGDVSISRAICGGNLISGYAHSRDLIYVSPLLEHYFTDEKIFETFRLCEENGINTAMLKFDDKTLRILRKYWHEIGGKIQWIAQICEPGTMKEDTRRAADEGAVGAFSTGQMGDSLVQQGRVDLIAEMVEIARDNGIIAGISCHELAVIRECEKAKVEPDFYMKTFNQKNYWSAGPKEQYDNVFNNEPPEETIELMKGLQKPWVAFKVLGAGAIDPRQGFDYAFKHGADFICVGMFDFQVQQDAALARDVIGAHKQRERVWFA